MQQFFLPIPSSGEAARGPVAFYYTVAGNYNRAGIFSKGISYCAGRAGNALGKNPKIRPGFAVGNLLCTLPNLCLKQGKAFKIKRRGETLFFSAKIRFQFFSKFFHK